MEAIETYKKGNYSIEIHVDPEPDDPRNWSNLGKMICFHGRYRLGDKHDLKSSDFAGWIDIQRYLGDKRAVVILPLYLYDHSGLRMKVGSFQGLLPQGHAEFDSGQVGFIVAYRADILKEYKIKRITAKHLAEVEKILRSEVKVYDQYLSGQVYGYVIYDSDGKSVDSCWGFYGDMNVAKKSAEEAVEWLTTQAVRESMTALFQRIAMAW